MPESSAGASSRREIRGAEADFFVAMRAVSNLSADCTQAQRCYKGVMKPARSLFRTRAILLAASLLLGLAACSDDDDTDKLAQENKPVDELYNKAFDTFNGRKYKEAADQFEEVERQHPSSPWAARAEIMAAYSAYRGGQYDDAVLILDRFVKLHPTSSSTAYAYYLKALSYYIQISDVGRDQKKTEDARDALKEVIARFPDTDYARDAKIKLDLTVDHLAGKEMEIGRYYLKRLNYVAAARRFKYVVDNYETTTHAPEALHRLVECYLHLGIVDEAKNTQPCSAITILVRTGISIAMRCCRGISRRKSGKAPTINT